MVCDLGVYQVGPADLSETGPAMALMVSGSKSRRPVKRCRTRHAAVRTGLDRVRPGGVGRGQAQLDLVLYRPGPKSWGQEASGATAHRPRAAGYKLRPSRCRPTEVRRCIAPFGPRRVVISRASRRMARCSEAVGALMSTAAANSFVPGSDPVQRTVRRRARVRPSSRPRERSGWGSVVSGRQVG